MWTDSSALALVHSPGLSTLPEGVLLPHQLPAPFLDCLGRADCQSPITSTLPNFGRSYRASKITRNQLDIQHHQQSLPPKSKSAARR
eukprot:1814364-Rhodomonas_salina.1